MAAGGPAQGTELGSAAGSGAGSAVEGAAESATDTLASTCRGRKGEPQVADMDVGVESNAAGMVESRRTWRTRKKSSTHRTPVRRKEPK